MTNKQLLKCLFSAWSSDQSELCYANIVAALSTLKIASSKLGTNTAMTLLFICIDNTSIGFSQKNHTEFFTLKLVYRLIEATEKVTEGLIF